MDNFLSVASRLEELVSVLENSRAVVLTAPPGAGKTTLVPPAILRSGLLGDGRLVMLEPRRVAARAAAAAMARGRKEKVGDTVGYKVRFDDRTSASTRIEVVTEGILTRRLVADPFLEGISCVVIDEFHERSVNVDLALAFVKELLAVRDDLRLVVMSATMNTGSVSRYLEECPVIEVEGRPFPLEIDHVPTADDRPLSIRTAAGIKRMLRESVDGDVLVFLPGAPEIRRLANQLEDNWNSFGPEIVQLYGALSADKQDRALAQSSRRRIVLATNIAETSLTIPGVTCVVDTGLAKVVRWDLKTGMDRLETVPISRQSAVQRAGRAGRTAPGRVLRLWTESDHRGRQEADMAEIGRVDPSPVLLQVMDFHPGDPRLFDFYEAPKESSVKIGLALLEMLGAIVPGRYKLSTKGKFLAKLPLHPRLGAILLGTEGGQKLEKAALMAALLEERELLARDFSPGATSTTEDNGCDLDYRAELLEQWEKKGASMELARRSGIGFQTAKRILKGRDQILRIARSAPGRDSEVSAARRESNGCLLFGFPDRVCRMRAGKDDEAVMVGGRGVKLAPDSQARGSKLFIAVSADAGPRGLGSVARVSQASSISLNDLKETYPHLLSSKKEAAFDPTKGLVFGAERLFYGDLLIEEKRCNDVDAHALADRLATEAKQKFDQIFNPDPAAEAFIARINFAAATLDGLALPDMSRAGIRDMLDTVCVGLRNLNDIAKLDWFSIIRARVDHRTIVLMDKEIPEKYEVPSGSLVRVDYQDAGNDGRAPVLAVKLQEMFGLMETPRIAQNKVPLTLHLLAPNRRPVQVTTDLASFWENTYPQVRKELRARYPKHPWPENPLKAEPTKRTKRFTVSNNRK